MRKVLLAFDGSNYSVGALEFAKTLNEKNHLLLAGAFLPQVNFGNLWSYANGGYADNTFIPLLEEEDAQEVHENIRRFEQYCIANNIEYRVHKDFIDFAIPELKRESRFADLLIIGSESFYEQSGTKRPNEYLQDALHGAECPVIIVPEKFNTPTTNILTYDGSEDSVFAIRQFSYLMPELTTNHTLLVYARKKSEKLLPDEISIQELASRHFPDLDTYFLDINPKKYFAAWIAEKENSILVSGSFGRTDMSRIIHRSFIDDVISDHRVPVFLAHK